MLNILLPTDFSENAQNAVVCALRMYEEVSCKFYILNANVFQSSQLTGSLGGERKLFEAIQRSSKERLQSFVNQIQQDVSNEKHRFETIAMMYDVLVAIKEVVAEKNIDLIVMGTKGATGLKQIFMGSNTVKVIKNIRNCPILAVPENHSCNSIKTIVFPTDFKRFFNRSELMAMIELAFRKNATIQIFHVARKQQLDETQQYNKEKLKKDLKELSYSFHKGAINVTIADVIEAFIKEANADLIALIHYRHTFFEKLTHEPIVKKIAFKTNIPLLILPETE